MAPLHSRSRVQRNTLLQHVAACRVERSEYRFLSRMSELATPPGRYTSFLSFLCSQVPSFACQVQA